MGTRDSAVSRVAIARLSKAARENRRSVWRVADGHSVTSESFMRSALPRSAGCSVRFLAEFAARMIIAEMSTHRVPETCLWSAASASGAASRLLPSVCISRRRHSLAGRMLARRERPESADRGPGGQLRDLQLLPGLSSGKLRELARVVSSHHDAGRDTGDADSRRERTSNSASPAGNTSWNAGATIFSFPIVR